jgi:hypothetical protein
MIVRILHYHRTVTVYDRKYFIELLRVCGEFTVLYG